ncbi:MULTISPECIES: glycosyltransferase [Dyadobacter]|uniref:Glycosyltransferase family protein n=1 Tax=Dyadobacter chenhuakuii TaxID=2909339 RepID=A0ABY4XPS8_9BACT|nr:MULTISPECIES: glycosyltransferase [Dyadobacter]MCE7072667.1 glycosyltransferase family protein [Dyadobacter sp. CY327]MCF2493390.1 glycosyltransferase family protein [Dyadobacter chenhuakuii]USJ32333.1 glycosyltransferase family protein [Dyadobacter chenhuakuii]
MLSIVICSANAEDLSIVKENIAQTVGIAHEIIAFDNRFEKKGICEVYNWGTQQARYDIICYMHEDVEIRTHGWGQTVIDIFSNDPEAGVLGVAGGGYKSLAPSGWYQVDFHYEERAFQNVLQGFKFNSKEEIHAYHNPGQEKLSQVVCVDGLWFCTRKDIALRFPFDAKLLPGFHGYDLDFCLSVYPEYKVLVTFEILMKHASEGNFDKKWFDQILKLHRKWSKILPLTTANISDRELYLTERRCFETVIEKMIHWDYSFYQIHKMLMSMRKSRIRKKLFFKSYQHLLRLKLGLRPLSQKS